MYVGKPLCFARVDFIPDKTSDRQCERKKYQNLFVTIITSIKLGRF